MTENIAPEPTPAEAREALADIGRVLASTRLAIAQGPTASLLMLWGAIWLAANTVVQFAPTTMRWIWWALDAAGIVATVWLIQRHRVQVRRPGEWRMGVFWGALIVYAVLWMLLLMPSAMLETVGDRGVGDPALRRLCAFWHTVAMFGYVVMGLWLERFFLWLGLVVTVLVLAGLAYAGTYLLLWLGVVGGGALILSGVFIHKFWK